MKTINYEAEAAVLGSVFLEGLLFDRLTVTEAQFDKHAHRLIFRAMKRASELGQDIDLVSVTTNLEDTISQVGGTTYLLQLAESVPTTENVAMYEQLLFEAYRNRKSREVAARYAANPSEEKMEQLISDLKHYQDFGVEKQEKTTRDYLEQIMRDCLSGNHGYKGFPTAYRDLDQVTGGLHPGELIIVAARPSVGKTAFALNLAANHCRQHGISSIFSLEMGHEQLLERMISAEGGINNQKWRGMAFAEEDYTNVIFAAGEISNWKLQVHEQSRTIQDIRSSLRKTIRDCPNEQHLAIIDYLQLMAPMERRERRDLEVGDMTRELKLLALELKIPIVLLSQLSRGVEQRQDKRPFMSDLRESGNIEQDADMIAFLYRDDYYHKNTDKPNIIEIILAKQRNGPTGTVELMFRKEFGRFLSLKSREEATA
ncbi:replicative DNA helicase [Radiobacillus sp. PE A8.2]|uniref:replicative DNA helicase n=1 Tax=Radiobacillus sp. PE A8.2 TaxID=3380349 RepID=UPI003891134F